MKRLYLKSLYRPNFPASACRLLPAAAIMLAIAALPSPVMSQVPAGSAASTASGTASVKSPSVGILPASPPPIAPPPITAEINLVYQSLGSTSIKPTFGGTVAIQNTLPASADGGAFTLVGTLVLTNTRSSTQAITIKGKLPAADNHLSGKLSLVVPDGVTLSNLSDGLTQVVTPATPAVAATATTPAVLAVPAHTILFASFAGLDGQASAVFTFDAIGTAWNTTVVTPAVDVQPAPSAQPVQALTTPAQ